MTAIDAAIIELEAHREHVCQVISTLRRFARVVEDAHVQGEELVSEPTFVFDQKAIVDAVKRHREPALAKPTPPPGKQYPNDAKVRAAFTGQWQTVDDIAKRAKLPKGTAYTRLTRLCGAGEVVTRPEGKRTLYRQAGTSTQLRPRTVAGTQAAPPAGPSSANGRQASAAEFEVAWNGTKERNGDAPSILPPRERRA